MESQSSKLKHQQAEQTVEAQRTEPKAVAREFSSPEEMLRHDAAQTEVPGSIKTRLADSLQKEPHREKPRAWWRRWFS